MPPTVHIDQFLLPHCLELTQLKYQASSRVSTCDWPMVLMEICREICVVSLWFIRSMIATSPICTLFAGTCTLPTLPSHMSIWYWYCYFNNYHINHVMIPCVSLCLPQFTSSSVVVDSMANMVNVCLCLIAQSPTLSLLLPGESILLQPNYYHGKAGWVHNEAEILPCSIIT